MLLVILNKGEHQMTINRIGWMMPALFIAGILLMFAQCYAVSPNVVAVEGNAGSTLWSMY
jgi:hypothetical protein